MRGEQEKEVGGFQPSLAALENGETMTLNGWKISRNKCLAVKNGATVWLDCVWMEDRDGRHVIFKGFDDLNVLGMLEILKRDSVKSPLRPLTLEELVC